MSKHGEQCLIYYVSSTLLSMFCKKNFNVFRKESFPLINLNLKSFFSLLLSIFKQIKN